MKHKNIHNLIIEGPDGVGKSTLIQNIFKHYNYRYMCYHRGELSNKIFAEKYHRPYYITQNNLPFLYIVLLCDEKELEKRIRMRETNEEKLQEELSKVKDNSKFRLYALEMSKEYDMFILDTTHLNEQQVLERVCDFLDTEINCEEDETISTWNEMYDISCKKYGLKFKVIENQPYINDIPINVESTLHNGVHETFTDKRYPDNLLYSLAYDRSKINSNCEKTYDFNYIINSKIKKRPEIFDYYEAFKKNNQTCLIANNPLVEENKLFTRIDRVFKEDFINTIAKSRATVYCARDLAPLKLQTARLYESILANNIVFVDRYSDEDCEILNMIYGEDDFVKQLLWVTPDSISVNYRIIMKDKSLMNYILEKQNKFYNKLVSDFEENVKNNKVFVKW